MTTLVDIHLILRWVLVVLALVGVFAGARAALKRPLMIAWTALLDVQWVVGAVLWWLLLDRGADLNADTGLHAMIMTLAVVVSHILARRAKAGGSPRWVYLAPLLLISLGHLVMSL